MKNTTIKQVEEYSCQTYGVTMEQVTEKGTKRKKPVAARRLIMYLLTENGLMPKNMIMSRYNSSYDIVSRAYIVIAKTRYNDVELNSVITEFENKLK